MEEGRTFQTERTEMRERPCLTFWVCRESDVARPGMQLMSRPEIGCNGDWRGRQWQ